MKKLLTNSILIVVLNSFTSAAPTNCIHLIKVSNISRTYISAAYVSPEQNFSELEIHPLDILSLKFK
ncbi:MAG TPA: hypothetical protein VLJ41_11360 [Segetibacter sp.]|nr:hypothetical protein [Segetibacter sp.]